MTNAEVKDALRTWQEERARELATWEGRGDGILKRHGADVVGVDSPDDLATRFEMIRSDRDFLLALDRANTTVIARLASLLSED